ncbi:MAG: hypothetical protein K2X27_17125 [Candidatus Obscuribacterales bacterium]|nr:hypothetical protein [Candidatus Obscuribacterales bacterium]
MANNQSGGDSKKKGSGINDMILKGMKSRSGTETTKWINNLTNEAEAEIAEAPPAQTNALPAQFAHPSIAQTQVKWVDKLFDLFQQYEVEFNRAVQVPDLHMVTERAVITPELISKMQGSDYHFYQGRLHTRYWTLAVRGNLSRIEGYIIPSDHYIGFEANISAYTQFFVFLPVWDGELKWTHEKGTISIGQLPSTAKQIFGHLVKVAKGDAGDSDRFGFPSAGPPAAPAAPAPQPVNAPDYLVRHGGVFEDEHPLSAGGESAASASSSLNAPAAETLSSSAGAAGSQKASVSSASTSSASFAELDLSAAFDLVAAAVDREIELISKAGARAFEAHDLSRVEVLMKRIAKLKSSREQMKATIAQWKEEFCDN